MSKTSCAQVLIAITIDNQPQRSIIRSIITLQGETLPIITLIVTLIATMSIELKQ